MHGQVRINYSNSFMTMILKQGHWTSLVHVIRQVTDDDMSPFKEWLIAGAPLHLHKKHAMQAFLDPQVLMFLVVLRIILLTLTQSCSEEERGQLLARLYTILQFCDQNSESFLIDGERELFKDSDVLRLLKKLQDVYNTCQDAS